MTPVADVVATMITQLRSLGLDVSRDGRKLEGAELEFVLRPIARNVLQLVALAEDDETTDVAIVGHACEQCGESCDVVCPEHPLAETIQVITRGAVH